MENPHKRAKEPSFAAFTPPGAETGAEAGSEAQTPVVSAPVRGDAFVPGYVFANRYRMIARIGRGGMGEVWRADDLVLETPAALKLIYATGSEGRARIINEVRLARQITHPAICRVFDVGEAEGQVFYSMELVQGEDLATLLRRVSRLPSEKVVDIALQLCGGLAAAHSRGVLHRDLKPANVLMDDDGRVRITDFGIAITSDETGHNPLVGTPAYMAPEQLVPGIPLSERTDLYALGLILYELLVGRRPFDGRTSRVDHPPRPSTQVPDVDPGLEHAIAQALAVDPDDRPPSAAAMAAMVRTASALAPPRRQTWPWLAAAVVAVVAGVFAMQSRRVLSPARSGLTGQDTIVLADFMNTTGEPVFDGTMKVALAVALEQSPFLKVFSDNRVAETLRLMQRAPTEPITRAVAREVAQRERLKALIAGSIGNLGTHYVLALEAVNADTGDVMAREQIEVEAKERVLTSLGAAAARLREKLGESLASIQKFDVPLPRATTQSLEALHAYALALDRGRLNLRVDAIPHLKRAIEIDPTFAMAYAMLSGVYYNTGQSSLAPPFSAKAFALRDRVSERERFVISWRYYLDAAQAWDKALVLAESWTATYPREALAFNSLGVASAALGQHERAVAAFREAVRLDPGFLPPHGNLVGSLIALNRLDEAESALQQAGSAGTGFLTLRRMGYVLAFLRHDTTAMARELSLTRESPDAASAGIWEARAALSAGRLATAYDLFRRAAEAARINNAREVSAQTAMEDAEAHAIAGHCADLRREITAGLGLSRDNFTIERASRTLALCGAAGDASALSHELGERFPNAILTTGLQMPVTAAAIALKRGEPAKTLTLLEPVRPYDHAPASEFWPMYLRGLAHLQLKDGAAAVVDFQGIVDHRGEAPTSPLYALAQLGLARSATLAGNHQRARQAYDAFFTLWNGADATLPQIIEARRESAALR